MGCDKFLLPRKTVSGADTGMPGILICGMHRHKVSSCALRPVGRFRALAETGPLGECSHWGVRPSPAVAGLPERRAQPHCFCVVSWSRDPGVLWSPSAQRRAPRWFLRHELHVERSLSSPGTERGSWAEKDQTLVGREVIFADTLIVLFVYFSTYI